MSLPTVEGLRHHPIIESHREQAPLPERDRIPEKITVIGAGIAGMCSAWVLSEIGYDVTIMDQLEGPMQGTSKGALGIHLGGRYPKSQETAQECLESAILVKKLMPFAINEHRGTLRFLVADTSDISFDEYVSFYEKHRNYYSSLPEEDQVFGPPESFFRLLTSGELENFINIQGGIASQEPLWDMEKIRGVLTKTLKARGVEFKTGTQVTSISPADSGYNIDWKSTDGNSGVEYSDVVINTAGYGARELSQRLGDAPQQNLQLRFFNDVKISKDTQRRYPFPVVVIPGYMHYVPLEDGVASIVGFSDIIDNIIIPDNEQLTLPERWKTIMQSGVIFEDKRAKDIVTTARNRFMPHIGPRSRPIGLQPGVAISYHQQQYVKQQQRPRIIEGTPGYMTLVPTKASHGISLALEAAGHILRESTLKGTVGSLNEYASNVSSGRNIAYLNH